MVITAVRSFLILSILIPRPARSSKQIKNSKKQYAELCQHKPHALQGSSRCRWHLAPPCFICESWLCVNEIDSWVVTCKTTYLYVSIPPHCQSKWSLNTERKLVSGNNGQVSSGEASLWADRSHCRLPRCTRRSCGTMSNVPHAEGTRYKALISFSLYSAWESSLLYADH